MHAQRSLKQVAKKHVLTTAWLLFRPLTVIGRRLYRLGLLLEFKKDWSAPPNPEWFKHELDLAFFHKWKVAHFFERGIYASELVRGRRVLDLCCGDGSVAALFVSPLAKSVLAVDFDPKAISFAQANWRSPNLAYEVMDIRRLQFAPGSFEVCLWEAAIEHFSQAEMDGIIQSIKSLLSRGGVLHGHTIKKQAVSSHHDHEYEFESLMELNAFLKRYFESVETWERIYADRTNFYFRCRDAGVPA